MALFFRKVFIKKRGKYQVYLENPPVRFSEVNYFDTGDLVDNFQVSLRQVYNWISSGILRPYRRIGKEYYFKKEDVERFRKMRRPLGRPKKSLKK
jgi:hypothetical protein